MNNDPIFYQALFVNEDDVFRTMFVNYLCELINHIKQTTEAEDAQYLCIYDLISFAKYEVVNDTAYDEDYSWTIRIDNNFSLKIGVGEDITVIMDGLNTGNWHRARNVEVLFRFEPNGIRQYTREEQEYYGKLFGQIKEYIISMCSFLDNEIEKYNREFNDGCDLEYTRIQKVHG